MKDIDEIYDYIRFLKTEQNLSVSLHPGEYDAVICPTKLHRFRRHENPYCLYLSTHPTLHQHCVDKQHRVWEKCGEAPFCGTCFAGVREYVYPILSGQRTIGFISVSGYRDEQAESYHKRIALDYGLDPEKLQQSYAALPELPPKKEVDVRIQPLQRMLELCYRKIEQSPTRSGENELCEKLMYYLQLNHTRHITIDELCDCFYCSRSSISHKFKAYTGQTITGYITTLRIEDAKSLLRSTNMSIGSISATTGFENSNYFTNVFTKTVGISPTGYRKQKKGV